MRKATNPLVVGDLSISSFSFDMANSVSKLALKEEEQMQLGDFLT